MIGAIAGDVIGSIYEHQPIKSTDFPLFSPDCRFTDDSVLTVAVADCLLSESSYARKFKEYFSVFPYAGYGKTFAKWCQSPSEKPYGSYGNGSAMRVSPIGFFFDDLDTVLAEAEKSAAVTHNHPEGIKGAQATAAAVFMARKGEKKIAIQHFIASHFDYDLDTPLERIRPDYQFDVSCQGSVPQALRAFLESDNWVDAVRKAISLGGDSDTQACIAGSVAQGFYKGVPTFIEEKVKAMLDSRLLEVVKRFENHLLTREGLLP